MQSWSKQYICGYWIYHPHDYLDSWRYDHIIEIKCLIVIPLPHVWHRWRAWANKVWFQVVIGIMRGSWLATGPVFAVFSGAPFHWAYGFFTSLEHRKVSTLLTECCWRMVRLRRRPVRLREATPCEGPVFKLLAGHNYWIWLELNSLGFSIMWKGSYVQVIWDLCCIPSTFITIYSNNFPSRCSMYAQCLGLYVPVSGCVICWCLTTRDPSEVKNNMRHI